MMEKIIGGSIGAVVGRTIGGIGIVAMGGGIGIPAVVVTTVAAAVGVTVADTVGKAMKE